MSVCPFHATPESVTDSAWTVVASAFKAVGTCVAEYANWPPVEVGPLVKTTFADPNVGC